MADNPLYNVALPNARQPVLDANGLFSNPWYRFFKDFLQNAITATELALIAAQVDALSSLVSQLLAQTKDLKEQVAMLGGSNDVEDLKRRIRLLEELASQRIH